MRSRRRERDSRADNPMAPERRASEGRPIGVLAAREPCTSGAKAACDKRYSRASPLRRAGGGRACVCVARAARAAERRSQAAGERHVGDAGSRQLREEGAGPPVAGRWTAIRPESASDLGASGATPTWDPGERTGEVGPKSGLGVHRIWPERNQPRTVIWKKLGATSTLWCCGAELWGLQPEGARHGKLRTLPIIS